MVAAEDGKTADVDSERGAKVCQGNVSWAGRIGRQEIRRFPDAAAGPRHIDGVGRGIRGIHGNAANPPVSRIVGSGTNRGPGGSRQGVCGIHRENAEMGNALVADGFAKTA